MNSKHLRTVAVLSLAALLTFGCTLGATPQSQALIADMKTIGNTAVADFNSAIAIANAANPPDADGATCAKAALQVAGDIQNVENATPAGSVIGPAAAAEIASLYQPGSAQWNLEVKTIETGCVAKLHDVNQAGASTVGMPAAMIAALGIAGAPVGL